MPHLPPEMLLAILTFASLSESNPSLRREFLRLASLVSHSFRPIAQELLSRRITITRQSIAQQLLSSPLCGRYRSPIVEIFYSDNWFFAKRGFYLPGLAGERKEPEKDWGVGELLEKLRGVEELWMVDQRITVVRKASKGLEFEQVFRPGAMKDLKVLRLFEIHWAKPSLTTTFPLPLSFTLSRLVIVWNAKISPYISTLFSSSSLPLELVLVGGSGAEQAFVDHFPLLAPRLSSLIINVLTLDIADLNLSSCQTISNFTTSDFTILEEMVNSGPPPFLRSLSLVRMHDPERLLKCLKKLEGKGLKMVGVSVTETRMLGTKHGRELVEWIKGCKLELAYERSTRDTGTGAVMTTVF